MTMLATLLSQVDARGGLRLTFQCQDGSGPVYGPFVAQRPADEVVQDFLDGFAVRLTASLKAGEIANNVQDVTSNGSLATPRLLFSTAAENFAAGRAAYADATRVEAVMIGDFLSTLTDAQLRTAFSMTQAQINSLRANKLTPAASLATSIRATTGQ